eukprot:1860418-Rhodomonas_salina.2
MLAPYTPLSRHMLLPTFRRLWLTLPRRAQRLELGRVCGEMVALQQASAFMLLGWLDLKGSVVANKDLASLSALTTLRVMMMSLLLLLCTRVGVEWRMRLKCFEVSSGSIQRTRPNAARGLGVARKIGAWSEC